MKSLNSTKTKINRIASQAKSTFNVSTGVRVLKRKAFKNEVGDPQRGGTYKYFQDCILINRDVARSYEPSHLKWMIFHEFGHAYTARVFAKHRFLPIVYYEPTVNDALMKNIIKPMWQGLCDYLVNELVSNKIGLKKFDYTLEHTIDDLGKELTYGMCFHLYDYWKHGRNDKVARKAKARIPLKILSLLDRELSLIPLDNPIDRMISLFGTIARELFQIEVRTRTKSKKDIEEIAKATLPKFWGDENTNLKVLVITSIGSPF